MTPERHWGWLLRFMKGEDYEDIAHADGVKRAEVRRALVALGAQPPRNRKYGFMPLGAAKAYVTQKCTAANRGIRWDFTPETWWEVWQNSGKWEHRGRGRECFVMARYEDSGPYAPWNVRIVLMGDNMREAVALRQHRMNAERAKVRLTLFKRAA